MSQIELTLCLFTGMQSQGNIELTEVPEQNILTRWFDSLTGERMNITQNGSDLVIEQSPEEILGLDRLEQLAHDLAKKFTTAYDKKKRNLLPEVRTTSEKLLSSYFFFTKDDPEKNVSPSLEWFLDNFHIIEEQIRSIKRDLPKNFYDELPKIKDGDFAGYPRVFGITCTYVRKTDCRLELGTIENFIRAYQVESPLTIGEIWAIAITFRIALLKQLSPIVDKLLLSRKLTREADEIANQLLEFSARSETTPDDLIRYLGDKLNSAEVLHRPLVVRLIQRLRDQDLKVTRAYDQLEVFLEKIGTNSERVIQLEHFQEASNQVTIGNIITSMRLLTKTDWHEFFEHVSLVDPILNQDPMDVYRVMDWSSRDEYRKVLEKISRGADIDERKVAKKAIALAQRYKDGKHSHVGHYLVGRGLPELEASLDYNSPLREKVVRFVDDDPNFIYFGFLILSIVIFTSGILKLFPYYHEEHLKIFGLILLIIIPVSEFSLTGLNFFVTNLRPPKRLFRRETKDGIRQEDRTMVVVPCLFLDNRTVESLVANLEVQYLANQDEHISFALLGDLADADSETRSSDEELLNLVHERIHALNQRYAKGKRPKFYIFHRTRQYNPAEGKWIAWERKRGKIMEFNKLIRGSKDTSFLTQDYDSDYFAGIKYVITLDADTQLPLQTARKLVGTITHPLNTPVYCPKEHRVVEGYGILQPRISVSVLSAAKTRFARVFAGNTGIDPYTTAVSDVYQDLFQEGTFTGKGLYVVDAFEEVIGDRVPENAVLSHDLLEGSFARVGLVSDLELIDDYPANFEVFVKRLHRWTRGDWQIAMWVLPFAKNAKGAWTRNRLPFVARWKIIDNLRRSLLTPVILLWLLLAWTTLPGSHLVWTLIVIITMSFPVFATSLKDFFSMHHRSFDEQILKHTLELKKRLEQTFLMVVFMPSIAFDQTDAILRALYRMVWSKKKLLEWVTFSQTQSQQKPGFRARDLISAAVIFALSSTILIYFLKNESLLVASPFLLMWALAPVVSYVIKKRPGPKKLALAQSDIEHYRRYARITWNFFEKFAREENNWLAPDNYQEDPEPVVAQRTSPTNMGLQFLATLSAYDLGYIGIRELVDLLEKSIASMKKLETMRGHFYNWYETTTLDPLTPKYISTVDSGNLAGHLIVLRQACLALAEQNYAKSRFFLGMRDGLTILGDHLGSPARAQVLLPMADQGEWQKLSEHLMEMEKTLIDQRAKRWAQVLIKQISSFMQDEGDLSGLPDRLHSIAQSADEFLLAMDFNFLYDDIRKIFVIGYNATDARRDDSYYDLLASESRLASFIAIAKGDVGEEHWFRLGRTMTSVAGGHALISWSATMFEYLMPLLVMRRFEETLIDKTYDTVVLRQMEYGTQRKIPWGISESGYNARDLNFNYQYGPFGIPGLGLKRGLRDELVVSPYSTMLAAMVSPRESLKNLKILEGIGALGEYGFHESIDYTIERIPKGESFAILRSFMAHHQGMSLISINNLVNSSIMQRRFHSDPRVKAVQLLLQEKIPSTVEISKPRAEETHLESFSRFSQNHYTRIYTDPNLSTPRTHVLSNGNYSVMMSSSGAGYSKCEDRMVTRWKDDPTRDNSGQFFFIKNQKTGKVWSATYQPLGKHPEKHEIHFSEDKIEFFRTDAGVSAHTEIIVSSEDNVELRRVSLHNTSSEEMILEVTSYMEVILAKAQDDAAHPAFSNLFVETQFEPKTSSLLAQRRLRAKSEVEFWGLHTLVVDGDTVGETEFETDRSRFIGRGRSIEAPNGLETKLSGTIGAVIDPVFCLRRTVRIPPGNVTRLTFTTGLVFSKPEALRLIAKYHDNGAFIRQLNLGWVRGQMQLRHLNISNEKAQLYQRLGGRILYLAPYLRAQSEIILANQKNQSALWAYGISGDLPIVLTQIQNKKDVEMIRELLRAHEYLRMKGLRYDLVILNEHATSYLQNLQDELMRIILISGCHTLLDKPGGIFIRKAALVSHEDLTLIKSVARVILFANKGILEDQLNRRPHERELPLPFVPTSQKKSYPEVKLEKPELQFWNGLGGFSQDGKEYVISLSGNQWTPAPWINVIANRKEFGFTISESGSGYTWSENSRENRLTPWSNDAVSDPSSEAIYLRDEETGAIWCPTPLPIRSHLPYLIRHGQGYTTFEHRVMGLSHELTLFVPPEESVKILRLKLKNESGRHRKISVTAFIEWVLGFSRSQTAQTLVTYWDNESDGIFARNCYNNEFAHRVAFFTMSIPNNSFTTSRREFIGRNGTLTNPQALQRKRLSGKYGGGLDPCGALQSQINLEPNGEKEIVILLGQAHNEAEARSIAIKYKNPEIISLSFQASRSFWENTLTAITVKTPDPSLNLLVNRWLPYQTLACRIWARSAFYQSGGAYGFRDQLQDVMAMIYANPEITREQILRAAGRQFPEGDVQHWWHPPTGRGVRTRFSDDLLWLPFVVSYYLQITEDQSILDEKVQFIETELLHTGHDETYTLPTVSSESATIFEHCLRSINRSLKVGPHGISLMGSGDWNDGMNRVGNLGTGESVWLAWFLIKVLKDFSAYCDEATANIYKSHLEQIRSSVEENAWDGEWYLRAYFDNGEKMGSKENEECQIDAIAQSWAILSGEGNSERSRIALESVNKKLIDRDNQIIKLFTPPFNKGHQDPGYIKGYLPGVRENGGQYTHAAIWTMMAYGALRDGETTAELFSLINPINRSKDRQGVEVYKVEPYVISADIYGVSPNVGRGGWSWYTGSSSWMYRAAIETILGLKLRGDKLSFRPCIPKDWKEFELSYRFGNTMYHFTVARDAGEKVIDLINDGKEHMIRIE